MRTFTCPKCGHIPSQKEDRTILVQCTECNEILTEHDVLPAENSTVEKRESPTILFRGEGWTERGK